MRFLALLVIAANAALFAYGLGLLGTPPNEQGRQLRHAATFHDVNAQVVALGTPQAQRRSPK